MNLQENVSLKNYSTMRLGGNARYLSVVESRDELIEALEWALVSNKKFRVIGGGSNVIFTDDGFEGLIIVNRLKGVALEKEDGFFLLKAEAGEDWDEIVEFSVNNGLTGIEALSSIPGTVGATPVQNVGAYGQEVSQTIDYVEVYNFKEEKFEHLTNFECNFSYRDSVFKNLGRERYVILGVAFRLKKGQIEPPLYRSLQDYLDAHDISDYSPANIRNAVIEIRKSKLPSPEVVANNGSFFKNPIISILEYKELQKQFPDIPGYETRGGFYKVPAGWLLDKANYKNYIHKNGMGTYEHHALVLVNYSASSYKDLEEFIDEIKQKIKDMFGIKLEQEPEVI